MGWWALVGAGGPVLGVTIGAPIIQYFGWRALFWGELPLMAIAAVLAVIVLPSQDRPAEDRRRRTRRAPSRPATAPRRAPGPQHQPSPWRQLDWAGSWTLALAVTASGCSALNAGPFVGRRRRRPPWPSSRSSLVAGVAFVLHERRAAQPLIPLRYFRQRNFVFPLGARPVGQLLLHGRVLPVPHPDGGHLPLQRDPGRAAVDGPAPHVLADGSGGRLRRGQGGGAVLVVVGAAVP